MPLKKRSAVGRIVAGAAVALAVLPAAASAADCPIVPTTQAFAAYGDENYYFLVPGGDFDSGPSWSRSGLAALSSTDNPFDGEGRAARMAHGGSWTSPELCFDSTYPHLRFGLRADVSSGTATVEAIHPSGAATLLGTITGEEFDRWGLSPMVPVAGPLGLTAGASSNVRLRITARSGDWRIDAVSVDPYRR